MRAGKREKNCEYVWVPPHHAYRDLPPSTYTAEHRIPLFLLFSRGENGPKDLDIEVYFLNLGDEILDSVFTGSHSMMTDEDDVWIGHPDGYGYEHVEPKEAVLVMEYSEIYASDFMLSLTVTVSSAELGKVELTTGLNKGKIETGVLLFNTGEPHKSIQMKML